MLNRYIKGVKRFLSHIKQFLFIIFTAFISTQSDAQVVVTMKMDTVNILIGEQVQLTTTVAVDAKQKVEFPFYKEGETPVKGIEIIAQPQPSKTKLNNGNRLLYEKKYTITSFDSALYTIPAMEVLVDNKPYKAEKEIGLKVNMVPVDTTQIDKFAGPVGALTVPFHWDVKLLVISLFAGLLLVLSFIVAIPLLTKKALSKRKKIIAGIAPYKQAMKDLDDIVKDEQHYKFDVIGKHFYMQLTDAIRNYLYRRFGCQAGEMTTDEILSEMSGCVEQGDLKLLADVFTTADLVKFAKQENTFFERETHLKKAQTFFSNTKDESLENPKPTIEVITLSDGIQVRYRVVLWVSYLVCLIGSISILLYVCHQLIQMYSY